MGKIKYKPLDYRKYRVRNCMYMNTCAVCLASIQMGQQYHDGGYGRRAHIECADKHAHNHDLELPK